MPLFRKAARKKPGRVSDCYGCFTAAVVSWCRAQARQSRFAEELMTELRPITEDNFLDAFHLRLAPGQEAFVSHPVRSLAQAYVYREQCQPFGIYADGKMVGYVMVIYDYDVPEYDIWHMMIDEAEQGKGYGSEALDRVLQYIRTKPFGDSDRVALTCSKNNPAARKLYESRSFSATGNEDEDEIELAATLA
jgi:diamine N-acetyltransferase